MSRSIDERVVEMQFNNRQFESGVKDSLGSLEKLKKGLNLEGSTKSLAGLQAASNKFSLSGIGAGVDTIAGKFSTLGIMGITALVNITNAAVNAGKRIVSALAIDPVKTGFNEFELKMNAIQTMMAGSGESLETVNKYLAELNAYSDRTIYSFSDMTQNIGKFTNAGVSLDDAINAIKGISNEAALSGANANEAARAMYNLSQAMSMGYVQLIDWKSIEMANMGTVDFKNNLLETAIAAKTVKKNAKGMYVTPKGQVLNAMGMFKDGLSDQWLTSEVLIKTLSKYSDETTDLGKRAYAAAQDIKTLTQMYDVLKESAQSGWAQTWEILVGNFDEGKSLFTELNDYIGGFISRSADARNEILQLWKDAGGRNDLIDAFKALNDVATKIVTPIREAFRDFFPPLTAEKLIALTKGFKEFTQNIKISEETTDRLRRIFKGVFAVLDLGKQLLSALGRQFSILWQKVSPFADSLFEFAAKSGDWLVALNESVKEGDVFNKFFDKLAEGLNKVKKVLIDTGDLIVAKAKKIKSGIEAIIEGFKSFTGIDLTALDTFVDRVRTRFQPLSAIADGAKWIIDKIKKAYEKLAPILMSFAGPIGKALDKLRDAMAMTINEGNFQGLFDIINSGLFVGILVALKSFIDSLTESSGTFTGAIAGFLQNANAMMSGVVGILNATRESLEAYQQNLKADTLLKIAIAIGILAAALFVLAMIDSNKLTTALIAISVLFAELAATMIVFQKSLGLKGAKGMMAASTSLVLFAGAVLLLAIAMQKLAQIDPEGISSGIIAITYLTTALIASAKLLSGNAPSMIKGATGFVIFAGAILLLTFAVKKLADLDPAQLTAGLIGVGVLMAELLAFIKVSKLDTISAGTAAGLVLFALAINLLALAVSKFGKMNVAQITKGLAAMAVVIGEVVMFTKLTAGATGVAKTAAGLMLLGAALILIAVALKIMGSMSVEQIAMGIFAMAQALAAITLALNFMPQDMMSKGAGLILIAFAILILSKAMLTMGSMSWEEIARGMVVLAGALAIIVGAMQFMTAALPGAAALLVVAIALKILAGAMKALGKMSLKEIGLALLVLVGVFAILGLAGLILAPVIPAILGLAGALALLGVGMLLVGAGMLLFSMGLAALAVSGAAGTAALVTILMSIIGLIPMLMTQFANGIIAFAKVIGAGAPVIIDALKQILLSLLAMIVELTPPIIDTLMVLLRELLAALVEAIPLLVDAGMKLILGFLQGIADNIQSVVQAGVDLILQFLLGVASRYEDIIDTAFTMIISFINGLATAIDERHDELYAACRKLIDSIINAIVDFIPNLVGVGEDIIRGVMKGFTNMGTALVDAAKGVIGDAVDGVKRFLGINSPSKEFANIGKFSIQGLVGGLKKFGGDATDEAEKVGHNALEALKFAMTKVADIVNGEVDMNPTIRPVLDLSAVTAGAGTIDSMFSRQQAVTLSSIAGDLQNGSPMQRTLNELKAMAKGGNRTDVDLHGTLTVQVENDKGEVIGIAQKAVTDLLRRESR